MVAPKNSGGIVFEESATDNSEVTDPSKVGPLYSAKDQATQFDPKEYLEGFYTSHKEDGAMQMVLFFLPGILYRLPDTVEDLLDLGAGPTIYIPVAVRNRAKNVYTSDYSEKNREKLVEWIENRSKFDWSAVCGWLACIESTSESALRMQEVARQKIRAVFEVNVHKDEVIQSLHYKTKACQAVQKQFDVVTSIFCLEYASETRDEYERAVQNAVRLIKPGGYLIQGGVLHADEYCFAGVRFKCHFLTRDQVVDALEKNSMCTDENNPSFRIIVSGEVFLVISQKLASPK